MAVSKKVLEVIEYAGEAGCDYRLTAGSVIWEPALPAWLQALADKVAGELFTFLSDLESPPELTPDEINQQTQQGTPDVSDNYSTSDIADGEIISETVKRKRGRPKKEVMAVSPTMTLVNKADHVLVDLKLRRGKKPKALEGKFEPNGVRFNVTDDTKRKVEEMAARGLNFNQIAASFGISKDTLLALRDGDNDFQNAIDRGRAAGVAAVAGTLYEKALGGDTVAMLFFLKCIGDWRETKNVAIAANISLSFDRQDSHA